jgi:hypothetical protein
MMLAVAVEVRATVEGSSLLVEVAVLEVALCCNSEICCRKVRKKYLSKVI